VDVARRGGGWFVAVEGELDRTSLMRFELAVGVVESEPGDVTFDLSGLVFVDSSGMRSILLIGRHLRAAGRTVRFDPVSQHVQRVASIAGLAGFLADPPTS
jgi:anti-anti-sigma factor